MKLVNKKGPGVRPLFYAGRIDTDTAALTDGSNHWRERQCLSQQPAYNPVKDFVLQQPALADTG